MGEYKQYKQELWRDKRAEIKVDPNIELEDYTGPVRTDLRFTDFSRKQLGNMYSLAHHYNYAILRAYREFIHDTWGPEEMYEAQEAVWGTKMVSDVHQFITETMNNKGKDLEAFMKHWQIDMNTQPGDHFDVIFEMPSKDRGIVTYNRCPVVEEYEASGRTDELHGVCMKTCPPGIKNMAALYNEDIDLKVLAMPPRKSKDHICCKFEVCYKSKAAKSRQEAKEVDLKIDRKKKDISTPFPAARIHFASVFPILLKSSRRSISSSSTRESLDIILLRYSESKFINIGAYCKFPVK